ncbi:MAG: 2Fe-2S iron-sulfur cluster-binding protein [Gammaproteobacteria bacterium]
MPKVRYTDTNSNKHEVELDVGYTLMEGAFNHQLPGMVAECGGACACGTCHCYIAENWLTKLPPIEDLEDATLYSVPNKRNNSRLTCQIRMTEDLDGIELEIAKNQKPG